MDPHSMEAFRFDIGVQRIHLPGEGIAEPRLPETPAPLLPSETGFGGQLGNVLNFPSLDGFLMSSMLPMVSDPSILMPHRYHKLLDRISQTLEDLADHTEDDSCRTVLREAVRFFSRERRLMELLHYYRHLLHQA